MNLSDKALRRLTLAAAVVFLVLAAVGCTGLLWYDEQFSAVLARHSWGELISLTAQDVHPPLYYLILKALCMLPDALWPGLYTVCCQVVSLLAYAGALLAAGLWGGRLFGARTGLLAVVCLGCMPSVMDYATEARMYSWGLLFVLLGALCAVEWLHAPRPVWAVGTGLFAAASLYTHYWAGAAAGMCLFCLAVLALVRRQPRRCAGLLAAGVGALILFAPWVPVLLNQMGGTASEGETVPLSLYLIRGYLEFLFSSGWGPLTLLNLLAIAAGVAAFGLRGRADGPAAEGLALAAAAGLTLLVGMAAQQLLHPTRVIFQGRYLVPALGLLWLGVAALWGRCLPRALAAGVLVICLACGAMNTAELWAEAGQERTEYARLTQALAAVEPGEPVLADNYYRAAFAACYLPDSPIVGLSGEWEFRIRMFGLQTEGEEDCRWLICGSWIPQEKLDSMGLTLAGEGISFTAKEDEYRFLPLNPAQP